MGKVAIKNPTNAAQLFSLGAKLLGKVNPSDFSSEDVQKMIDDPLPAAHFIEFLRQGGRMPFKNMFYDLDHLRCATSFDVQLGRWNEMVGTLREQLKQDSFVLPSSGVIVEGISGRGIPPLRSVDFLKPAKWKDGALAHFTLFRAKENTNVSEERALQLLELRGLRPASVPEFFHAVSILPSLLDWCEQMAILLPRVLTLKNKNNELNDFHAHFSEQFRDNPRRAKYYCQVQSFPSSIDCLIGDSGAFQILAVATS
jgi:hypothetical protein